MAVFPLVSFLSSRKLWPHKVFRRGSSWFALFTLTLALPFAPLLNAAEPNDPYFLPSTGSAKTPSYQWGLHSIGLTDPSDKKSGWSIETGTSRPVIVAVIDTGLDFHHPDLNKSTIWRNEGETANGIDDDGNGYIDDLIGWNFEDDNNNPWDFAGHGTHVAGVIGAASNNKEGITGINWGVKIMPLKVLSFTGRGGSVNISEAIFYAIANGAEIINLSLGGENVAKVEMLALDYAHKMGVLVIVAAGNSAINTSEYGLAASDNVILVASASERKERSNFSNWGTGVDIAAPGEDILSLRARRTDFALVAGQLDYEAGSAYVGGENKYYLATGTSFAAPFVTGVASLIFAHNKDITAEQVKRMLLNSAEDIDVPGIDQYSGFGLLNAYGALKSDPDFLLTATIDSVSVVSVKGKPKMRVIGSFDADRLSAAWIEVGKGENPKKFEKVTKNQSKAIHNNVLDDLDVNHFRGAKTWTLRLVCKHKNGQIRESRFVLNLG